MRKVSLYNALLFLPWIEVFKNVKFFFQAKFCYTFYYIKRCPKQKVPFPYLRKKCFQYYNSCYFCNHCPLIVKLFVVNIITDVHEACIIPFKNEVAYMKNFLELWGASLSLYILSVNLPRVFLWCKRNNLFQSINIEHHHSSKPLFTKIQVSTLHTLLYN